MKKIIILFVLLILFSSIGVYFIEQFKQIDLNYSISNETEITDINDNNEIIIIQDINFSRNCSNYTNKKDCYYCESISKHDDIFKSCEDLNGIEKDFCNYIVLKYKENCEDLKNPELIYKCKNNNLLQIDCNIDNPRNSNNLEKINLDKLYSNINSQIKIYELKPLELKELETLEQEKDYNLNVININPETLDKCTLNKDNLTIDYNNKRHSTFYFNYDKYHFVYNLELHEDLVNYSIKLKNQYCYTYKENESARRYFMDEYNNLILKKIANDFNSLKDYNFNDSEILEIAVRFVQEIPYNYNWDNKNTYPYETLWSMKGLCLDKSVILSGILKEFGYSNYIVVGKTIFEDNLIDHAVVAVSCNNSDYYINSDKVCYIETTNKNVINDINFEPINVIPISDGKKYIESKYGQNTLNQINEKTIILNNLKSVIDELKTKEFANNSEIKEYNSLVNQYNSLLYEIRSLKFENYN